MLQICSMNWPKEISVVSTFDSPSLRKIEETVHILDFHG